MYMNHNHSNKMSWRNFQQELQRESRNTRQNIRQNIRISTNTTNKQNNSFTVTASHSQKKALLLNNSLPIKPLSSIQNRQRNKTKTPIKKAVISIIFIIVAVLTIQKVLPALVNGTQKLFIEASIFLQNDATSFLKTLASSIKSTTEIASISNAKTYVKKTDQLSKQELKTILKSQNLLNLTDNVFTTINPMNSDVVANSNSDTNKVHPNITINTTLDMRLQNFLLEQIDSLSLLDRGKPEIIALIAMEPHSGKILAMAGFDSHSPETNPCTDGVYPAASLFKIVTASAAVETCGYSPTTTMYFSGGKYTLYKRQLTDGTNLNSLNKVTLAEAFAQSINPVFGKLGSLILGKDVLEKYAASFGFNKEIDSEISFRPGNITITENSYQWAEVACGFNTTTTISPIFGAMLASTMLNSGKTPIPCIVDTVKNDNGKVLYKRKDEILNEPLKPDTAKAMMQMMNGTIITGTARKSFRGFDKDSVLSRLKMGGKTGSLSSYDNSVKFDWFTGFCTDTQEKQQIVVSVLVGHGKYIGTKASIYGRLMFKEYFNNYFALNSKQSNNG